MANLFLYSLSLIHPTALTGAVSGQFSGAKQQEILVARGSILELFKVDAANGKLLSIHQQNTFGILRAIVPFRLAGSPKGRHFHWPSSRPIDVLDYVIIAADSGKITIIEYVPGVNQFIKLHQETYGKSGVRRVVPGQYLSVDPKGRAVMIASIEKSKLVYVLNRDSAANLTISSPLEAHRPATVVYMMIGLDVGYENPVFASLEADYGEIDYDPSGQALERVRKMMVYYELDLGLNHVVRKWAGEVDRNANILIQVPGGNDGPSGVLIGAHGWIIYKHQNKKEIRCPIPRRSLHASSGPPLIVAWVLQRLKTSFFFLVQTEDGDLFKITLTMTNEEVEVIRIKYFDTVPVATSICILRQGFLFVGCEHGNHALYRFESLGDNEDEPEFTSNKIPTKEGETNHFYFKTRSLLNLALVDQFDSLAPLMDSKILNLTQEDSPQIYTVSGQGCRSTFRALRHGLEVTDVVGSELPAAAVAVWTTKLQADDEWDQYIVLSFANGTLVLSIGETVEEVTDSGLLLSAPTIRIQQIGENALIQIHAHGIRHITLDKTINEWKTPQHTTVLQAATNQRQAVVALSNGELVYFEVDEAGELNEFEDRKQMPASVTSLSIADVPEGRVRTDYLAVGCDDSTVRIISLDPENTLESLSLQALSGPPSALRIIAMQDPSLEFARTTLYLHIGLQNGIYLRTVVDPVTGQLVDTRTHFLGSKPVQLFQIILKGQKAVLALSSRSWVAYSVRGKLQMAPLSYETLNYAWKFSSETCPEGIVSIQQNILRIFMLEKLEEYIKQESLQLDYTPRRLFEHPDKPLMYTIESENQVLSRDLEAEQPNGVSGETAIFEKCLPRSGKGCWASCIRIIDPLNMSTIFRLDLTDNEAAFSAAFINFQDREGELFLAVGTAKNLILGKQSYSEAQIHTYLVATDGASISLVHKTAVDDIPRVLIGFQGRLLAGVGPKLRIYDIGTKKLLRKCELRATPHSIVHLDTQGSRIVAGDSQESIFYIVYKHVDNKLICFADDVVPRWTTTLTMVDYETVAGGDKFGNVWVLRCPQAASELADDAGSTVQLLNEKRFLNAAVNKLSMLAHYHVGDIPTSIHKVQLVSGGREILVYCGFMGTIGLLIPFVGREDVDFFQQLEGLLRSEDPPLSGRDHMIYRGYYAPVKGVIDGDLCEKYSSLSVDKQKLIAAELDRTPAEIQKKIEEQRVRTAY